MSIPYRIAAEQAEAIRANAFEWKRLSRSGVLHARRTIGDPRFRGPMFCGRPFAEHELTDAELPHCQPCSAKITTVRVDVQTPAR